MSGKSETTLLDTNGRKQTLIYWIAGIATYPSFFANIAAQLEQRLEHAEDTKAWVAGSAPNSPFVSSRVGGKVSSRILYPYGDYRTSVWRQIVEIGRDLKLGFDSVATARGGRHVYEEVLSDIHKESGIQQHDEITDGGLHVVLIGHSGGGVAAYHAARLLQSLGKCQVQRVILIGSPRVHIHPKDKELVRYYYTWNDPVAHIGGWFGIRKLDERLQLGSYAPAGVRRGKVKGWHPDYFNQKDLGGVTNASRMLDQLWEWLHEDA